MNKPNLPIDKCTACGACVSTCNKDALNLSPNEEGFYAPICDETKCVGCLQCESVCHILNAFYPKVMCSSVNAFMLKAKDIDVVKSSSSGGLFSLLANYVIKKAGNVYGAAYDYEKEILKCSSVQECSLNALKKAKYVESFMGNIFRNISQDLLNDKIVLFCGTPCQCRGLRFYVQKKKLPTQKLLIVRFICHGVPSNQFLTDYIHWMEQKYKSNISYIDFRPKNFGWRIQSIEIKFKNGKVYKAPYNQDFYFSCFFNNNDLRNSCYDCSFDKEDFPDLTIGDFWGIHFFRPENKDQEGISVVLAHNEKGKSFLENISGECIIERLPTTAIEYLFKERDYNNAKIRRDIFMKSVAIKGYMPAALDLFGNVIRLNQIRWKLSKFKQLLKKQLKDKKNETV